MKKSISVSYDEERYQAIQFYAQQKGVSIETELAGTLEGLFQKVVPANVRYYLDMKQNSRKGKKAKTSSSSAVPEGASED